MAENAHSATSSADPDMFERLHAELAPELELLRPLGAGSTAHVFLATEPALKRLVAVKVMRPELAVDTIARRRFEREAQSAARISHTNVTYVHRVGRLANDIPYIVMEYIDGRSLEDALTARGPFPLDEVTTIVSAVAAALGAAHDKDIVHRDVNAGNVFIENRTGRVVLTDFGIVGLLDGTSSALTRMTALGHQLGQVRYSSPEQLRGETVTEQSDVYSLGIVAYEIITGKTPFEDDLMAQVVLAHLEEQPRPLREVRPEVVGTPLARVVHSCLAKDPKQRPRASDIPTLLLPGADAAPPPATGLAAFLHELKRRRVYQVVVAYAATAFVLLQGASLLLPTFEFLGSVYNVLVALTVIGFPIAIVLSWLYDISEGRVRRTKTVASGGHLPRQRLLPAIGLTLSVLIAVALWWLLARS